MMILPLGYLTDERIAAIYQIKDLSKFLVGQPKMIKDNNRDVL